MRDLLSQPSVSRTADGLVLHYGATSILLWCCIPLFAAALGTAGLVFVHYHKQRANPPLHPLRRSRSFPSWRSSLP